MQAYPLDRFTLFLGDADGLSTWWQRRVLVSILSEQLKELLRMLSNQLGQLWVASTDLLKDWLKHLRLLLYNLSQLLELWIVTQEF